MSLKNILVEDIVEDKRFMRAIYRGYLLPSLFGIKSLAVCIQYINLYGNHNNIGVGEYSSFSMAQLFDKFHNLKAIGAAPGYYLEDGYYQKSEKDFGKWWLTSIQEKDPADSSR